MRTTKHMTSPPTDLRRFRSYKGTSVRDLLRAIRNKVCLGLGWAWLLERLGLRFH